MIDKQAATEIALTYLSGQQRPGKPALVLLDDKTLEQDFGWIFFYNSQRYAETRNDNDMIPGLAPLIVSKTDGSLAVTGTARPLQYYIQDYKYKHGLAPEPPDPSLSWSRITAAQSHRPSPPPDQSNPPKKPT